MGLAGFEQGKPLKVSLNHADGTREEFTVSHSYNQVQIEWFKAGSALNLIRMKQK